MSQEFEHLHIVREVQAPRRRNPNRGGTKYPSRGDRSSFADELRAASARLIDEASGGTGPAGIQPHLVFRVPLHEESSVDAMVEALGDFGLTVVAVESEQMIVAFHDEIELDQFRKTIDDYEKGPRVYKSGRVAKTSGLDKLQAIEPDGMVLWGRADRVRTSLAEAIGDQGELIDTSALYTVDVELWYPGRSAAIASIEDIRTLLAAADEVSGLKDVYVAPGLALLRMQVTGTTLDALLEVDSVFGVDSPPRPSFDPSGPGLVTRDSFNLPSGPVTDGPSVCVLDTGVAGGHPMIAPNLGDAVSFIPEDDSPADDHSHGTKVCGQALYGDVRAHYLAGEFISPLVLFSAKVIGSNGEFDDHKLMISQLEDAVSQFSQPPYNCRVFNFSVGFKSPLLRAGNRKQGVLAESLDRLARKYRVLFVVSAGNHDEQARVLLDTGQPEDEYPGFLFCEEAGLCDPATAAIALSVGGLTERDSTEDDGSEQIRVPLARSGQPAPMTRTGPGVNAAVKPDLTEFTGNSATVMGALGRRFASDRELSVLCLSYQPSDGLFLYGNGTSLAAPRVARTAALLHHSLQQSLDFDVHPNLVRALLANSALIPAETASVCGAVETTMRAVGYGRPDEGAALGSASDRVTLIAQDAIPIDYFHIYEIPVPNAFQQARGIRRMTVSLAFDPPVRGSRYDYLAVEMEYGVIRGRSIDDVFESCRHVRPGEKFVDLLGSIQGACKLDLKPAGMPQGLIRRGRSTLQAATHTWQVRDSRDYGDSYWLVLKSKEQWPSGETAQDYAVAVTLQAEDERLYAQMRARVRERGRARVRQDAGRG